MRDIAEKKDTNDPAERVPDEENTRQKLRDNNYYLVLIRDENVFIPTPFFCKTNLLYCI